MKKLLLTLFTFLFLSGTHAGGVMRAVEIPAGSPYKAEADRTYLILEKQVHYLLSLVHPWKDDPAYKLTTKPGDGEHSIRPNTGAVGAFAFLYKYGDYSEEIVGIGRRQLLDENIIPMLRYLIELHVTGPADKILDNGKKWGFHWQSALWVWQMSQAVWAVWDELPPDLREGARRLVAAEADRVASRTPPFRIEIDSKSEENAWDSMVLSAAMLLMPDDPKYFYWETIMRKWQLSSYSRPADRHSPELVDGIPMKDQFPGANIHDDYTLENHGIAHPDYMAATTLLFKTATDYIITGRQPIQATLHNLDGVYEQLKFMLLPGGQFGYPSGQDWAIFRGVDFTFLHAANLLFFRDPDALHWLRECLDTLELMQARGNNGAVYGPNENFFDSAQAHLGIYLSEIWRVLMFAQPAEGKFSDPRGTKTLPDGKLFIRRTEKAMHTVSWGRKVMIQSFAYAHDPMVCSDWQNGPGYIRLTGEGKNLPVSLTAINIDEDKPAYSIIGMTVMHGDDIRADIIVKSYKNGKLSITEKLTAVRDVETDEIATLCIGFLNHPDWIYERGYREITAGKQKTTMKSMSGESLALTGRKVTIDGRMTVKGSREFNGSYTGASKWQASKLVDRLIINQINKSCQWKQGEVISEQTIEIIY